MGSQMTCSFHFEDSPRHSWCIAFHITMFFFNLLFLQVVHSAVYHHYIYIVMVDSIDSRDIIYSACTTWITFQNTFEPQENCGTAMSSREASVIDFPCSLFSVLHLLHF